MARACRRGERARPECAIRAPTTKWFVSRNPPPHFQGGDSIVSSLIICVVFACPSIRDLRNKRCGNFVTSFKGNRGMRLLELHSSRAASKHNRMLSVLLALALNAGAGAAHAQTTQGELPQSPSGTIRGTVTVLSQQGEPNPLEGIRVELAKSPQDSQPLATLTDAAGPYEFTQSRVGIYTLRVNQQGFKPFAEEVSLAADQTSAQNVTLALATVMDKMAVQDQPPTPS